MRNLLAGRRRAIVVAAAALIVVVPLIAVLLVQESGATATPAGGSPVNRTTIDYGFSPVSRPSHGFSLPRLEGRGKISLAGMAGQPIVINFWSSSCTVCQKESPAIARVAAAAHGRVRFLGIDTADERTAGEAFARKYHLTYPLVYDAPGETAAQYGVPGLPVTFFLSPSGHRVIGVNIGALTGAGLTRILHRLYNVAA